MRPRGVSSTIDWRFAVGIKWDFVDSTGSRRRHDHIGGVTACDPLAENGGGVVGHVCQISGLGEKKLGRCIEPGCTAPADKIFSSASLAPAPPRRTLLMAILVLGPQAVLRALI